MLLEQLLLFFVGSPAPADQTIEEPVSQSRTKSETARICRLSEHKKRPVLLLGILWIHVTCPSAPDLAFRCQRQERISFVPCSHFPCQCSHSHKGRGSERTRAASLSISERLSSLSISCLARSASSTSILLCFCTSVDTDGEGLKIE